jgi:hypothetical protein
MGIRQRYLAHGYMGNYLLLHIRSLLLLLGSISAMVPVLADDLHNEEASLSNQQLLHSGITEIVALHQFFQGWYRGLLKESGFARFEQAMHEDFHIIMPDSNLLRRAAIIDAVRQQRGSDPETTLEIRNVRLASIFENTAVFMYEEWQGSGAQEP